MAKRIIEGLWDCPYCKTAGIGGLTKHCPCCGHPQDAGTKFYVGQKKRYLDEELAEQYGQGADWHCPFCGSMNRVRYQFCSNCAAPKDSSEADYFDLHPKDGQDGAPAKPVKPNAEKPKPAKKKRSKKKLWFALTALLLLFAVMLAVYWPRTYDATVSATVWAREIDIEAYRTVQESDWSVPDGGRVYDKKSEFSHYQKVLDHYETRTRQVSEQVYDGEDYYTSYSDNGDGTFTEQTYSSPRYRTEWYTETYEEPIYRDDPVYATKYYYEIEKWVVDREEKSSGANRDPYWPEYTLAENERTGFQGEVYIVNFQTEEENFSVSLPMEIWEKYHMGNRVKIRVINGNVVRINDDEIE